jgi:3-hydroxyisobutyrate dehydrogenase
MQQVGFVGLGQMGWPMSTNLTTAGFSLVVYDADALLVDKFVDEVGGSAAKHPGDFAGCDIVITMLPNGHVVQSAMLEWEGGIGPALRSGALVIEMSSSDPADTHVLADRLAAHGVSVVDAPVSGGVQGAIDATLSIMPGGDSSQIERAIALFDVLGDPARRFPTGPLGTGHAMKALNNFIAATTYAATVEALAVGQTVGLDPETMVGVINASTGRSFTSEIVVGKHIVTGAYATGFRLGLLAKDVSIAASIAARSGLDVPESELTNGRWSAAAERLDPMIDHSHAHEAWFSADLTAKSESKG